MRQARASSESAVLLDGFVAQLRDEVGRPSRGVALGHERRLGRARVVGAPLAVVAGLVAFAGAVIEAAAGQARQLAIVGEAGVGRVVAGLVGALGAVRPRNVLGGAAEGAALA